MPVVGIGGINASNCGMILKAGADGVAVIGSIFSGSDIGAAAAELRAAVDQAPARRRLAVSG